jgi:predicted PurR-regulated permease PerM
MLGSFGLQERRWLIVFLVLGSAYFAVLLLQLVVSALGNFSSLLLILFLAWLLAFVMSPVVDFIDARTRLTRGAVAGLVYLLILVALGFALFYAASAITQQIAQLAGNFPVTEQRIEATLRDWQASIRFGRFQPDLVALFRNAQAEAGNLGSVIFAQLQSIAGVTIATVGALVLITILSLYMVMDSERILAKLRRLVPRRYEDEVEIFERSVARAFGGFLRAQVFLALVQALLTGIIGFFFGLPYLALAVSLSALAMLVPFFGPPLALIPPVVAALIFKPEAFWPIAVILLITQTLIVNWLQPRLMQGALGMHPILVLVALLIGNQVAGVWGALFGIPVVAVLNVFVNYLINLRTIQEAPELDVASAVAEVRREAPGASKELLVAIAAERAEEGDEPPATQPLSEAATDLRQSAQELRQSSAELKQAVDRDQPRRATSEGGATTR